MRKLFARIALAAALLTAARAAAETAVVTDHDAVAGKIGFGFLGVQNVPTFVGGLTPIGSVSAPVLGVRFWTHSGLGPAKQYGLDVGLGLGWNSSSTSQGGTSVAGPGVFALLLHGGLPLALATVKHLTIELVPELDLGFSTGSSGVAVPGGTNNNLSGFILSVGARAGGELHFGFAGIPELSVEASVGLKLDFQTAKTTPDVQGGVTTSASSVGINTQVLNSPWDFFRATLAARYYF
jgi:hypothetical protein